MKILGAVQPLVLTKETYRTNYGEEDPEELTLMQETDRELAQQIAGALQDLFLLETNLAEPREGEGLSEEIGSMEDLEELRSIAAALHGKTPDDYQYGRVPPGFQFNHLINHSGDEGFYLPADFPQAFFLDEIAIGSAAALLRELEALEPVLAERFPAEMAQAKATPDDAPRAEISGPVGVWHSLGRLCRSALAMDMPIQLG